MAGKYATYSRSKINYLKKARLTQEELRSELMLTA
jgi:hypothetical protein